MGNLGGGGGAGAKYFFVRARNSHQVLEVPLRARVLRKKKKKQSQGESNMHQILVA